MLQEPQPQSVKLDYFTLLQVPKTYNIDLQDLELKYKKLQQKLHPDLYTTKCGREQKYSAHHASEVNLAHATLKHPLARARYLLKLRGRDATKEEQTLSDPEVLMEVMEMREAIDEAKSDEELCHFYRKNKIRIADTMQEIDSCLSSNDDQGAETATVFLSYLFSIESTLKSSLSGDSLSECNVAVKSDTNKGCSKAKGECSMRGKDANTA